MQFTWLMHVFPSSAVKKFQSMEKTMYTNMFQQSSEGIYSILQSYIVPGSFCMTTHFCDVAAAQRHEAEAPVEVPFHTRELLISELRYCATKPGHMHSEFCHKTIFHYVLF